MVGRLMATVEVTIDDRWFLPVPDTESIPAWAEAAVADLQIDATRSEDPRAVVDDLVRATELADAGAVANLLYCPDGLPGHAIVSVYAERSALVDLSDVEDEAVAALPRQVLPFADKDEAVARIISTVRQDAEGRVLGVLQLQELRDGAFIETIVSSPSLGHLGLGLPLFEQLASRIVIVPGADR